jgi:hypothetical protein
MSILLLQGSGHEHYSVETWNGLKGCVTFFGVHDGFWAIEFNESRASVLT